LSLPATSLGGYFSGNFNSNERKFMMKNFDFEQTINGASAPGRELTFAPQNISCNTLFNSERVQNVNGEQNGRSMIEMLGVLAIIGVLSVGGIAGYSKAMMKYRINKTIEQITLIAGNVRTFFAPQGNYEGLGDCHGNNDYCKLIKKAKLMPDEMWDDTDKEYKNVFGCGANIYPAPKSKEGDNQALSIGYNIGENIEECIELLTYDWTAAGVKWIKFYGKNYKIIYLKAPISVDSAVESCSKINNNCQSYIDFYFDADLNGEYYKNITWTN